MRKQKMPNNKKNILNWDVSKSFLEDLLHKVESIECVSFDIFDTSVTRVVETPAMVFAMLEQRLSKKYGRLVSGFGRARLEAESFARNEAWLSQGVTEVTLTQIYNALKVQNKFSNSIVGEALLLEIECELEVLFGNPDILKAVQEIKSLGKKVIFVSDIYHSEESIVRILRQCGYEAWDDLILSSVYKKTKSDGSIWPIVLERYPSLLHVGDNFVSDVKTPRAASIPALHYARAESLIRSVAKPDPDQLSLSFLIRRYELFTKANGCTKPENKSKTFERLGATLGALSVGTFARDISQQAVKNGIDRIFFCSRDGYFVKQAWEALGLSQNCAASTSYLYVSRRSLALAYGYIGSTRGQLPTDVLDFITNGADGLSFERILKRCSLLENSRLVRAIRSEYSSLNAVFNWAEHAETFRELLQKEASSIRDSFEPHYHQLVDYLTQEGFFSAKSPAIVDLGWHGSMQKNLSLICKSVERNFSVKGFYFGLWPQAGKNRFAAGFMHSTVASEFKSLNEQAAIHEAVDTLEELFSAPHGSVLEYKNVQGEIEPVFAENPKERSQYRRAVEVFQESAINVLKQVKDESLSTVKWSDMTAFNTYNIIERIFLCPTDKELQAISSLGHSSSYDHSDLTPIVINITSEGDKVKRLRESGWRVGTLKYSLSHAEPEMKSELKTLIYKELSHLDKNILTNLLVN